MRNWSIKKELSLHLFSTLILLLLITVVRFLGTINLLPLFALGAVVGMIVPDIDHIIYALYLHPTDLSSQRVRSKLVNRNFKEMLLLLYTTREERRDLVFHNSFFVILFSVFTVLVLSTSGSLFGRGFVIFFFLHLLMDQVRDFRNNGNINNWFSFMSISITFSRIRAYFWAQLLFLLLAAFIF